MQKLFDKIQYPFIFFFFFLKKKKKPPETEHRKYLVQYNKSHTQQPIANIVLNDEKLKAFPLKIRN